MDSWSLSSARWSGDTDQAEAAQWKAELWSPHGFSELFQPTMTHQNGLARSRLDRVYSNHGLYDQLDREYHSLALPRTGVSDHRPISFGRRIPQPKAPHDAPISRQVYGHPDFGRRVAMGFTTLKKVDQQDDSSLRKLVLVKRAIHLVATSIQAEFKEAKKRALMTS